MTTAERLEAARAAAENDLLERGRVLLEEARQTLAALDEALSTRQAILAEDV